MSSVSAVEDQPSDEPADAVPDVPVDEQLLTTRMQAVEGDAQVLVVEGEVDVMTANRLTSAVSDALVRAEGRALVVDLTGVSFLGSHGLTALSVAALEARERREPLRLVVDENRPVIRSLEIAGLDHLLALFYTVEEALAQ